MLQSLKLYSKYFLKSAFSPERKYIIHDLNRFLLKKDVFRQEFVYSDHERNKSLVNAINWLINAQAANSDGGMGSYHLINKWTSSYPETTGYIIPTLIAYHKKYNNPETLNAAVKAADFLVKIQKPGGGWQGGRIGENKPEIVFNTAQVIRGMLSAFRQTGNKSFLEAGARAGQWLTKIQLPEGFWQTHALMNIARVYDTFVDVPLLQLYSITGDEQYKKTAILNLEWVIDKKMHANGWFEDCDNTIKRNDKPILHTIAYTIDGLIDCGTILKEDKYIRAAKKGAEKLRELFLFKGCLHGRYDRNWQGSEFMICTGGAQMAIIWLKLYKLTGEKPYLEAALRMLNLLIFIQSRNIDESGNTLGAIPGSFPLWGRYEPFAFPNWATKFFCDAMLLEVEVVK
jgi:hypothetical protein